MLRGIWRVVQCYEHATRKLLPWNLGDFTANGSVYVWWTAARRMKVIATVAMVVVRK